MEKFVFQYGLLIGAILIAAALFGFCYCFKSRKRSYGSALLSSLSAMLGVALISEDRLLSGALYELLAIPAVTFLIMTVVFFILWCFSLTKK